MVIEISDSLKQLIKEELKVNYDDYEVFYINILKEDNYSFILRDKEDDMFIRIEFNKEQIKHISLLMPILIRYDEGIRLSFKGVNALIINPGISGIYTYNKDNFLDTSKYDVKVKDSTLVYFKLYDTEKLIDEVNSLVNFNDYHPLNVHTKVIN